MSRLEAMFRVTYVLVLVVSVCASKHGHGHGKPSAAPSHPAGEPLTVTPSGAIRGSWMTTRRGRSIEAYRGVRYAENPTGALRFEPPKPILRYSSEVNASAEGPACPQPVFDPSYYIDEDCLRLNVYTPGDRDKRGKPLPVLVYIHSGGFYSVSGRSDVAGPSYLLDKDLVLVTINYRLASLGFLSTGDKHAPGNNGFKDQVAALKWVKRNIRSFGGDPELVTIAGCSAGGFSVMLHMLSPMSEGLFHRAFSISGSPISHVAEVPHQRHLAVRQAELLNCTTESSKAIIDCLRTKPWRDIGNTLDSFFNENVDPILVWTPVIEPDFGQERFIASSPLKAVQEGRMHAVPYIISQTTGEFFWKAFNLLEDAERTARFDKEWDTLAPVAFVMPKEGSKEKAQRLRQAFLGGKKLLNDTATADGLGKLYGDSLIGFGAHRLAKLMSHHSPHKVWYYEFAYVGNNSHYEDPETKKPTIAAHHDDLIYLFSLKASFPDIEASDSKDSLMVDRMTGIMYNFAKNGDPNPPQGSTQPELSSLDWPAMKPQDRKYLRIAEEFSVRANMFEDRFKVWDELYPIQY